MSKRKGKAKSAPQAAEPVSGGDLVDARIEREQRFALALWQERRSFAQIRSIANLPPDEGGLGYDISESAVRGLVLGARERLGDLSMTRAERIDRQADEVDTRARAARFDMERAYAHGAKLEPPVRAEYETPLEWVAAISAYARAVEATTKAVETADRRLDAAQRREAALHGLDAATKIEAEVVTTTAVELELADMLASNPLTATRTPEG